MILGSDTTIHDVDQMITFYKEKFAVVEAVSCKKCESFLAIECSGGDGMGLQPNELGKFIISVGDDLLSHRVRLDEAPTGERMVGYQCGAPVPNPLFPAAKKEHEDALAEYQTAFDKQTAQYEKDIKKATAAKKKDEAVEMPVAPEWLPPNMRNVPEFIECGNDTRIADIERGHVPVGKMQTSLSPFEKHEIRKKLLENREYKADFKKVGHIKHFETFQVERI